MYVCVCAVGQIAEPCVHTNRFDLLGERLETDRTDEGVTPVVGGMIIVGDVMMSGWASSSGVCCCFVVE